MNSIHGFVDYGGGPPMQGSDPDAGRSGMEAIRQAGARKTWMQSAGSMGDDPENSLNVSIGAALTRMGNGDLGMPSPFRPREANIRQLLRGGMSEVEAQLMLQTGGLG